MYLRLTVGYFLLTLLLLACDCAIAEPKVSAKQKVAARVATPAGAAMGPYVPPSQAERKAWLWEYEHIISLAEMFAVAASLIAVAYQIRSGTVATRGGTYQTAMNAFSEFEARISQDNEVATIYTDGLREYFAWPPAKSDTRSRRFSELVATLFNLYESLHYQCRKKLIDMVLWAGWVRNISDDFKCPGILEWWLRSGDLFSESFRVFIFESVLYPLAGDTRMVRQPFYNRSATWKRVLDCYNELPKRRKRIADAFLQLAQRGDDQGGATSSSDEVKKEEVKKEESMAQTVSGRETAGWLFIAAGIMYLTWSRVSTRRHKTDA
jgi:hypothetical protein